MNSDLIFDFENILENKRLIALILSGTIFFLSIIYLINKQNRSGNLNVPNQANANNNNNNINDNSQSNLNSFAVKSQNKYKLTLNCIGTLFKDLNNFDLSEIYSYTSLLSKNYEIFLLLLVNENEDQELILNKFKPLIEDNIILKHRILFCSKLEGLCAMVRSINPIVHIESK